MPVNHGDTRETIDAYGISLLAIASSFQYAFGDSSLMALLIGDQESNPLVKWQNSLAKISTLISSGEFQAAKEILESALIDGSKLQGPGVDVMLAYSWGNLGFCYFKLGNLPDALMQTERALKFCRSTNDADGIRIYLNNLCQIYISLGRSAEAAQVAHELLQQ